MPCSVAWKKCAHSAETTCLAFNRDGNILYTGGADGIVKGWEMQNGIEKCTMALPQKGVVTSVASSLDNEFVMAATLTQNKIELFRTASNNRIMSYTGHTDCINACAFNFSSS